MKGQLKLNLFFLYLFLDREWGENLHIINSKINLYISISEVFVSSNHIPLPYHQNRFIEIQKNYVFFNEDRIIKMVSDVMNKIYFILVILSIVFLSGCITSLGISGTYVNEQNPKEYLELHSDGTFIYHPGIFLSSPGLIQTGEYQINGDKLRIFYPSGIAYELQISSNRLILESKDAFGRDTATVFIKQN